MFGGSCDRSLTHSAAALAVAKLAAVCPGFIAFNCRNICFKLSSSSRPLAATDFWIPPICTSSIGSPTSSQGPWPPLSVRPSVSNCPITVQFYLLSKEEKPFITPALLCPIPGGRSSSSIRTAPLCFPVSRPKRWSAKQIMVPLSLSSPAGKKKVVVTCCRQTRSVDN